MANRKPEPLGAITADAMREMFRFERSRLLLTALELGLFTQLGDQWKEASEIAAVLGTDERATERLMNALCSLGILIKNGERFGNSEATARLLVKGKSEYMSGLMHMVSLWNSWSHLTESVRHGIPAPKPPISHRDPSELEAFIAAMHANAAVRADAVVRMLDLSNVSSVLDVGGGSGGYALAFARAKPSLKATVFDLPNVLPLTQRYIAEANLKERVTTAPGDYLTDDLGEGFDLVFLSMVVHSNAADENRALLKSVWKALDTGGCVVIHEMVLDENRAWPPYAALFAINMLVNTQAGDSYTQSEIGSWLKDAGFSNLKRLDTSNDTTLLIGLKKS